MSFGLEIFNASGVSVLDTSLNAGRMLSVFDVTSSETGSVTDARFSGAVVLAVCLGAFDLGIVPHNVSISGTTCYYTANGYASRIYVIGKTF